MTHLPVREWGRVPIGDGGFTRAQANGLLAAARAHSIGGADGTDILCDHHRFLRARQAVGVIAARGCSLEILPKVDPEGADETAGTVRARLVHMLDVALGLKLSTGESVAMAHRADTLLDMLIEVFADRLLAEVRHGLPRQYREQQEDLRTLRGRLDIVRQFTVHAVRPDRLACGFDALDADTPLMRVMKACVLLLARHARGSATLRKLTELRFLLAEVTDIPLARLPWKAVRIDRTSRRWQALLDLTRLLIGGRWQQTHSEAAAPEGVTLLFRMNDLFERYIAIQLRRALAPLGLDVVAQGGFENCLGDWRPGEICAGRVFRTKPDLIVRDRSKVVAVIDTKWKCLSANPLDPKHGVAQADVYQLMAYARLYHCDRLILLYPARDGQVDGKVHTHGIAHGHERLDIATVALDLSPADIQAALRQLVFDEMCRDMPKSAS